LVTGPLEGKAHPADGTGAPVATVAVVAERVDLVDGEADPPALDDEHPARHRAVTRVALTTVTNQRDERDE
jgi:hypothetical protein